jgi:hypothetical protein
VAGVYAPERKKRRLFSSVMAAETATQPSQLIVATVETDSDHAWVAAFAAMTNLFLRD